jgi:hypothetical protein
MSDEKTTVVGQVDPAEMQAINSLQTRERELNFRIGQMFRELLGMSMQAGEAHQGLQNVMAQIRERAGIDEEHLIRITMDGNVHLVEPPEGVVPQGRPQAVPTPPPAEPPAEPPTEEPASEE